MAIQLSKLDRQLIEGGNELPSEKALEVKNLIVSFRTDNGKVQAVRGVSFDLYKGETLCIVGESGSGKSVTSKAIMGILSPNAMIEGGQILYHGIDLTKASETEFQRIRGRKIGMIFQDPLSSLNPIVKIGKQITETMLINSDMLKRYYDDLIAPELTALMNAKSKKQNRIEDANNRACLPLNGYESQLFAFAEKKNEIKNKISEAKRSGGDLASLKDELANVQSQEKAYKKENSDHLKNAKKAAKKEILAAKTEYSAQAPGLKKSLCKAKKAAKIKTKERHDSLIKERDEKLRQVAQKKEKLSLTPEQQNRLKELKAEIWKIKIPGNAKAALTYVIPKLHQKALADMASSLSPLEKEKAE
ncbi:MAG TPA: hypothetical protein DEA63_02990, partial [Firmicutes bacterium]|nr:hypothetical protein [Bacillota bacterium]